MRAIIICAALVLIGCDSGEAERTRQELELLKRRDAEREAEAKRKAEAEQRAATHRAERRRDLRASRDDTDRDVWRRAVIADGFTICSRCDGHGTVVPQGGGFATPCSDCGGDGFVGK